MMHVMNIILQQMQIHNRFLFRNKFNSSLYSNGMVALCMYAIG